MLITYTGRRTGRRHTLPVQYVEGGGDLVVVPAQHEMKTWWRNLRVESQVSTLYRGRWLECSAQAIQRGDGSVAILEAYLKRFPRSASQVGSVPNTGQAQPDEVLQTVTKNPVIVIIRPIRRVSAQSVTT